MKIIGNNRDSIKNKSLDNIIKTRHKVILTPLDVFNFLNNYWLTHIPKVNFITIKLIH